MQMSALKKAFKLYKETHLAHRYIDLDVINPLLENVSKSFKVSIIGKSVLGNDIHAITIGTGKKRILLWSQMHGNESTTTKSLFDVINTLRYNSDISNTILSQCTLVIIPMLNPDGAHAYTRVNANEVDLNRDASDLSQPESLLLRACFNTFNPDYCFNLHGQRTIFSVGNSNKPATVSFLAPAEDEACTITATRKKAMEIIAVLNGHLQKQLPNQIGIYDDTFNINCVGDTFQSLGVPTILFEAGHFNNDYARETTREYIYQALLVACSYISKNTVTGEFYKPYLEIPENKKCFFDIIIRNARLSTKNASIVDIGIMYQEKLLNKRIHFVPIIEKIGDLNLFFGHKEFQANKNLVCTLDFMELKAGSENDFVLIGTEKYSLKLTES